MNQGRGGAGGDSISLKAFEIDLKAHLKRLSRELSQNEYRPPQMRRYEMKKKSGKTRLIGTPSVQDRVVQRAFLNILAPFYENRFHPCSFGYRPGRNVGMAIRKVVDFYDEGFRWVADADIEAFFDRIPHDALRKLLAEDIKDKRIQRVLNLWMAMGSQMNQPAKNGRRRGLLQGNVISPMMANVYLHQFDERMVSRERKLVRYGDDFLLLCRKRKDAEQALHLAREVLGDLGLNLNDEKTRIVHFGEGVTFLGKTLLPEGAGSKGPSGETSRESSPPAYWIFEK